jgi:stage V sporulation protein D (sporulation-specific penicillin-binding protein)
MENKRRLLILLVIFVVLFVIAVLRLAVLQILQHSFYEKKSLEQRTRIINLAAQRGDIFDRQGNLLATSIDSYSVFLYGRGWLARKLPLAAARKLQKKNSKRGALLKEKKRVYPKDDLAAQVMGFVGTDNQGLSGIELAFDEYLRGKEGRIVTEGDPGGKEFYGALRELEPGVDGMNLTLTIDENIQYVAERELEKQIRESRALSGMCLVMDAKTGELLAVASKPDFNPNAYQRSDRRSWHPRFLDPYEPGSTFKLTTVAAALEEGKISLETKLRSLDTIKVGGKVIGNSQRIDWSGRWVSVSKMIEKSINTASVQVAQKLGPERFHHYIRAFGFGRHTGFGLWGESRGIVRPWKRWYKPDIAMISFGQSIAVTPLQILSATSAFANRGRMVRPFLVKKIESCDGKFIKIFSSQERGRPVSERVADQVKQLMRNAVSEGSGRPANIEGFEVCGKTGTSQKPRLGGVGYLEGHYIASFVGFAPFHDPRIIALVIIDDPKETYWGGRVCGPVFKEVVGYTLRYLNVKPDIM